MNKRISVPLSDSEWLKLCAISAREDAPGSAIMRQAFKLYAHEIDEKFQTKSENLDAVTSRQRGEHDK